MNRENIVHRFQMIKDLLSEWAAWSKDRTQGGYPSQVSFATERVQSSNRSTESYYDNAPPDIIKLDRHIESLAPMFKQILRLEYFDNRPTKTKAAILHIPRQVFAQRISWIHEQLAFDMYGDE